MCCLGTGETIGIVQEVKSKHEIQESEGLQEAKAPQFMI